MSELKYKVGDRVRIKNFDWFRNEGAHNMVIAYMKKYCGEIVTIKSVHKDFYRIKEDDWQYCWTDEMIECKVEEKIKPKFKVGDRVKIKSLEWYNENKDKYGIVYINHDFIFYASKYCGKVLTISKVLDNGYFVKEDNGDYYWTDEMIECLVERNGKTYPYKIGDRVVLKGSNRCATITDLKYNSWGNLSYYIKIDNDKDISTDYPTDLLLPYDNKIKGFIEEETIPIPKFKVCDKITNGKVTLTILTLSFDRYVVKDNFGKCGTLYFNTQDDWKLVEEKVELIDNLCKWVDEYILPDGYQFKDENGNIVYAKKIVLEKTKEYPKTYEECCEVLVGRKPNPNEISFDKMELCLVDLENTQSIDFQNPLLFQLNSLFRLLMCRNAYWKIYGEENGLGKPWEPDYDYNSPPKYTISCYFGDITKEKYCGQYNRPLSFPTAEMRDAFYENFKKEIEICKEFL